jgi:guanylate kinase
VVVSGPSGVGKSVVVERLLEDPRFARAVTATTRAPRGDERDGVHYRFLAGDEFRRRVAEGWFLEHAVVYGNLYGTPREGVEAIVATGRHCVLVIDVQGAETLRRIGVDALFVFLEPPSLEELARRLRARGGDSSESVERRLADAREELRRGATWDHRIVNHDVDRAAREIASLAGLPPG